MNQTNPSENQPNIMQTTPKKNNGKAKGPRGNQRGAVETTPTGNGGNPWGTREKRKKNSENNVFFPIVLNLIEFDY